MIDSAPGVAARGRIAFGCPSRRGAVPCGPGHVWDRDGGTGSTVVGVGELILVSEADKRRLIALTRRLEALTDRIVSAECSGCFTPEERRGLVDALTDAVLVGVDMREALASTPTVEERIAHLDFPTDVPDVTDAGNAG